MLSMYFAPGHSTIWTSHEAFCRPDHYNGWLQLKWPDGANFRYADESRFQQIISTWFTADIWGHVILARIYLLPEINTLTLLPVTQTCSHPSSV